METEPLLSTEPLLVLTVTAILDVAVAPDPVTVAIVKLLSLPDCTTPNCTADPLNTDLITELTTELICDEFNPATCAELSADDPAALATTCLAEITESVCTNCCGIVVS